MLGRGTGAVQGLATMYIGFDSSRLGGLIGGARGFVDGGIGGLLIAIVYNRIAKE
ncbi:MAG: hypothetical protein GXP45_00110 [bacterium]|nr:hypothetical protein [bacterium]